jgi:DNA-binding transcriptional ArsR family regulator
MADLLPSSSDASGPASDDPRVVGLDSDDADRLLAALSSRTARQLFAALHEEPATPSALADRVDTSLQNVQYHIEKLADAGVIEVTDTVYSEKGREMKVYAPADRALVVFAGRQEESRGLKAALKSLLGGVGLLAVASVVVDRLLGGPTADLFGLGGAGGAGGADGGGPEYTSGEGTASGDAGAGGAGGENLSTDASGAADTVTAAETGTPAATETVTEAPTATPQATGTPTEAATETPATELTTVADAADPTMVDAATTLPPGVLFFLGGLTVLLLVVATRQYGG